MDNIDLYKKLFTIKNNWKNVLYIHSPFCVQKCYYCVYSSKVASSQQEIEDYYTVILPKQIEECTEIFEHVKFDQIYFGGGTPTLAKPEWLENVYNLIPGFNEIPKKISEASPYTVTDEHLDLFFKYKFSYISLGVQTLNDNILKRQNRKVVPIDKLIKICRKLEESDIIANMDLIMYLLDGELQDLDQGRSDLNKMITEVKPTSITVHSNYLSNKTLEKSTGVIQLLNEILNKHNNYSCVNSKLNLEEVQMDMDKSAEYRLMKDKLDFHFYGTPNYPQSHRYGYNMVAVGKYETFKPRFNFFYIYDYIDPYAYLDFFKELQKITVNTNEIRKNLGLETDEYIGPSEFFINDSELEKFKAIINNSNIPFHSF